jgi:hypothetical protein
LAAAFFGAAIATAARFAPAFDFGGGETFFALFADGRAPAFF